MSQQNDELFRAAVSAFQELGLTKLTLKNGDFQVELEKEPALMPVAPAQSAVAVPVTTAVPAPAPSVVESAASDGSSADTDEGTIVKAPLIGVFYASPTPDAPPFVKVGDHVKKGDILCIIEAMKMMNEITAEEDGTVSEVIAENGKLVEFGQPLFKLTD